MRRFEDEMVLFAKPLFTSSGEDTTLDGNQRRILAGWLSLITILAEFIDYKGSVCIPENDRLFLKKRLIPPDTWTIIACSSSATKWYGKYRHHALSFGEFTSLSEYYDAIASGRPNNSQISTFGMGHLFVQIFSCPNLRYVSDFRAAATSSGFCQVWPVPSGFWPFSKRLAKFPMEMVLDDEQADTAADAYNERIKFLTQPPYFGGNGMMPP